MQKNSSALINGNFKSKDIISLDQFSPKDIKILFSLTKKMRVITSNSKPSKLLAGKIVTLLFFEPSSRTFASFSVAVKRLGGQTIEIQNPKQTASIAKGESLKDTIRTFEAYSDAIILRHPKIRAAHFAAYASKSVPVINAGDGVGEHPTQALLDLYTIYERFNRLNNLIIVIRGDILHSRTIHSLIIGLSLYSNNTIYLLSPKSLKLPKIDSFNLLKRTKIIEISNKEEIPKNAHIWYWNRIQKERFKRIKDAEKYKNMFVLTQNLLKTYGNKQMIIMDPLPRVGEILPEIDDDPRAVYFRNQIRNGMYVRMALLALVLGKI